VESASLSMYMSEEKFTYRFANPGLSGVSLCWCVVIDKLSLSLSSGSWVIGMEINSRT